MTDFYNSNNLFSDLPLNYDEYIKYMNIHEWPGKLTSETILPLKEEFNEFQNVEEIEIELQKNIIISFDQLDKLNLDVLKHNDYLLRYANSILDVSKLLNKKIKTDQEIVDEMFKKLDVNVKEIATKVTNKILDAKPVEMKNSIEALNLKSVDFYPYVGFDEEEHNRLPGSVDPLFIMRLVVKRVKFGKQFRRVWWKIFSSEYSIALLHDLFWWTFLDAFRVGDEIIAEDKGKYFERIALNFGLLVMSVEDEIANKFLVSYPDVLAMTLYALFYHSFPSSRRLFGPDFKQRLVNTCHVWITGIHPFPNSFTNWTINDDQFQMFSASGNASPQQSRQSEIFNNETQIKEFYNSKVKQTDLDKELTKSALPKLKNKTGLPISFTFSTVLFDPNACSPLINKFLQIYNIEPSQSSITSKFVNRLELDPLSQSVTLTCKEQLKEYRKHRLERQLEHNNITIENEKQMKLLAKQREELEKRFENLQKEIDGCSNVLDKRKAMQDFVNF